MFNVFTLILKNLLILYSIVSSLVILNPDAIGLLLFLLDTIIYIYIYIYYYILLYYRYGWLTISSYYGSIPLTLELIVRDDGLITLCHSCEFACQQRVLKTFPGPGYLPSEDAVVRLWLYFLNCFLLNTAITMINKNIRDFWSQ